MEGTVAEAAPPVRGVQNERRAVEHSLLSKSLNRGDVSRPTTANR